MVLHLDVESEKNFRVKDSCLLKDSKCVSDESLI